MKLSVEGVFGEHFFLFLFFLHFSPNVKPENENCCVYTEVVTLSVV